MIDHPNVRDHLVHVRTDEEESPQVFGPYTRRKAEELAAGFNARIEGNEVEGAYTFIHATAFRVPNPQSVAALRREMGL